MLGQRIVVRYHMAPLSEALFQATGGLPRKVDLPAHDTLLAAALARAKLDTADHAKAAVPEVSCRHVVTRIRLRA